MKGAALRALVLTVLLAAFAGLLHWLGVGLPLVLGLVTAAGVVALLMPLWGVRWIDWLIGFLRGLYWKKEEGRYHAFAGVELQIEDDGRHVWMDGRGLLRVLGRTDSNEVIAARLTGHWRHDAQGQLMLRVDAVTQWLAQVPERNEPRVLRLRRYLEREILFPAEQRKRPGR